MSAVRDTDHGYAELRKRWMNADNRAGVVVGIFGKGAAEDRGEDLTNLLLAILHEFGAPHAHVPARSWLRAFVDEHQDEIRRVLRTVTVRHLKGQLNQDQALGQLGAWITGKMQARIAAGIDPPLAASTLAARAERGSTDPTPLIDTGQFRQAITWEVRRR